jgi:Zn-finger nucleic acid-binding protein
MNCPSCGAPLSLEGDQESLTCDYCKSIYLPDQDDEGVRLLGEADGASCPICAVPLMHATLGRQRIRTCTHCRGMLIPMGNFLALIEELKAGHTSHGVPHAPGRKELDRRIEGAQCHQHMDTHYYGGPGNVVIDDCSHCFLNWLDHGELMRIVEAPDRSYGEEFGDERAACRER